MLRETNKGKSLKWNEKTNELENSLLSVHCYICKLKPVNTIAQLRQPPEIGKKNMILKINEIICLLKRVIELKINNQIKKTYQELMWCKGDQYDFRKKTTLNTYSLPHFSLVCFISFIFLYYFLSISSITIILFLWLFFDHFPHWLYWDWIRGSPQNTVWQKYYTLFTTERRQMLPQSLGLPDETFSGKFMPGIRKKISQWKSYDTFPLLELLLIDVCCINISHYSVPKHSWTCIKQSAVKVLKFFPLHYCNFHLYLTAMITFDWVPITCVCCLPPVLDFHLNRTTQIKLRIICFIKWIPCLSVVSQNQLW